MSGLLNILAASEPSPAATTSSYMPSVRVEIAWNAGYLTSAALRTWTDVTDYVELGEGITITGGRGDERSTADANHLTLTFDNSDGRFTFGKTSGPYGSSVKLGRPIRVISDPVDGVEVVEFLGFIDELPTDWSNGTDNYATTVVTATSRLSRLGTQAVLKSATRLGIVSGAPYAFYALGEGSGALAARDSSGNLRPALTLAGTGAAPAFGSTALGAWDASTGCTFSAGQSLSLVDWTVLPPAPAPPATGAATIECAVSRTGAPAATETVWGWIGVTTLLRLDPAGTVSALLGGTTSVASAASVCDGTSHHCAVTISTVAGTTTIELFVDGVSQGTTSVAVGFASGPALTIGGVTGGSLNATVWNVVVSSSALPAATIAVHANAVRNGYSGETTSARLLRYAGYAGMESAAVSAETGQTTVQGIDTTDQHAVDLMRVMETTEGGVLFDAADGTLTFHNRAHRLAAASAFTLSMASHTIEQGYVPKADRTAVANVIDAKDVTGRYIVNVFDAASQSDNGVATMSIETASEDDDEPLNLASWALGKYKDVRERVPSLTVNALAQVGKTPSCAAVMAATVGTKITISNRPTSAASSSVDYFVEGWTKVYGLESLFITWNLSPTSPEDQTLILSDASRGFLGVNPLAL